MLIRSALALGAALVVLSYASDAASPPAIAAAPLHTSGARATYPRLTKFPNAEVMAGVNAALQAREQTDRDSYKDCLAQLKEMKMKPDKDTYSEEITVRYLSARLFSIQVTTSYYCAGAYPTSGAEMPVSFNLANGAPIDWSTEFKPGFLNVESKADMPPPGVLTKVYRARYSKAKDDAECRQAINAQDPFSGGPIVWLNQKGGVVFQPDFPHALAACATPLTLSPAEVAPYLKNAAFAADLKATVHK